MLRRSWILFPLKFSGPGDIASNNAYTKDPKGRFNLEEAAEIIGEDPEFCSLLYKDAGLVGGYNKFKKHYPAEMGRGGRPGDMAKERLPVIPGRQYLPWGKGVMSRRLVKKERYFQ